MVIPLLHDTSRSLAIIGIPGYDVKALRSTLPSVERGSEHISEIMLFFLPPGSGVRYH